MQITSKGQITIPKHIRELGGLHPHTEAEFTIENGKVVLKPAKKSAKKAKDRGTQIVEHLLKFKGNGLTADEIMRMTRE